MVQSGSQADELLIWLRIHLQGNHGGDSGDAIEVAIEQTVEAEGLYATALA